MLFVLCIVLTIYDIVTIRFSIYTVVNNYCVMGNLGRTTVTA